MVKVMFSKDFSAGEIQVVRRELEGKQNGKEAIAVVQAGFQKEPELSKICRNVGRKNRCESNYKGKNYPIKLWRLEQKVSISSRRFHSLANEEIMAMHLFML